MSQKQLTSGKFWFVVIMIVVSIVLVLFAASLMDVIIEKEFENIETTILVFWLLIPAIIVSVLFNIIFAARMKIKGGTGQLGKR